MRFALLVLLTAWIVSCSRPAPDATPEGVLKEWLERMDEQLSDPKKAQDAYALLSKTTHEKLEKRAERSSRIAGHRVEPYEVVAQGRFALRFNARHFSTQITGDTAAIQVTGDEPTDSATIHCVREGHAWRIILDLPDLTNLPQRVEAP